MQIMYYDKAWCRFPVRANNQPQVLHASTAKLTDNTCLTCPQPYGIGMLLALLFMQVPDPPPPCNPL